MKLLAEIAAAACGLLFTAAVAGKLDAWRQWSRLTDELPVPAPVGRSVRVAVPLVETAVGVLSFTTPIVGLAAGAAVLAFFAIAVLLLARRLSGRECNCFGAIAPATISERLAARNLAIAILAVAGWFAAAHEHLDGLSSATIVLATTLGAIALILSQFWRLHRATRLGPSIKEG